MGGGGGAKAPGKMKTNNDVGGIGWNGVDWIGLAQDRDGSCECVLYLPA
jgi:hypothetical protein